MNVKLQCNANLKPERDYHWEWGVSKVGGVACIRGEIFSNKIYFGEPGAAFSELEVIHNFAIIF